MRTCFKIENSADVDTRKRCAKYIYSLYQSGVYLNVMVVFHCFAAFFFFVFSPSPRLEIIDFGTQYTTQTHSKEFVIENRGRQPRKLVWNLEPLVAAVKHRENPNLLDLCLVSVFHHAVWVKQS